MLQEQKLLKQVLNRAPNPDFIIFFTIYLFFSDIVLYFS